MKLRNNFFLNFICLLDDLILDEIKSAMKNKEAWGFQPGSIFHDRAVRLSMPNMLAKTEVCAKIGPSSSSFDSEKIAPIPFP